MQNQETKNRGMKILLATDGSEHSKAAVEEVANRPFPLKTEVRILSVYEKVSLLMKTDPMGALEEYYNEADHYALQKAKDTIENAAKILRKKNPALIITTTFIDGSAKSVILKEAETFGADLVVVGSHGFGAVKRFMLGSVSHAVSLHAKCSVEIVRK